MDAVRAELDLLLEDPDLAPTAEELAALEALRAARRKGRRK
jgi:hypothetical protein